MVKNPFKGRIIAITGDFGKQRSHEKIKQWIEANGGTYAERISVEVTHLVCSKKHYKGSVTMGMFSAMCGHGQRIYQTEL